LFPRDFGETGPFCGRRSRQFFWGGRYGFRSFLFRGFHSLRLSCFAWRTFRMLSCLGTAGRFRQGADGVTSAAPLARSSPIRSRATCSSSFSPRGRRATSTRRGRPGCGSGARSHVSPAGSISSRRCDASVPAGPPAYESSASSPSGSPRSAARADTVAGSSSAAPPPRLLRRRNLRMR